MFPLIKNESESKRQSDTIRISTINGGWLGIRKLRTQQYMCFIYCLCDGYGGFIATNIVARHKAIYDLALTLALNQDFMYIYLHYDPLIYWVHWEA